MVLIDLTKGVFPCFGSAPEIRANYSLLRGPRNRIDASRRPWLGDIRIRTVPSNCYKLRLVFPIVQAEGQLRPCAPPTETRPCHGYLLESGLGSTGVTMGLNHPLEFEASRLLHSLSRAKRKVAPLGIQYPIFNPQHEVSDFSSTLPSLSSSIPQRPHD